MLRPQTRVPGIRVAFVAAILGALLSTPFSTAARAEENPAPARAPRMAKKKAVAIRIASDEEAAEALKTFKSEFKAKGLKGEDKLSQRDYAMQRLSKVMHTDVVKQLGKHTRSGDAIIRTLAVVYLGEMSAFPSLAGKYVDRALKRNKKDRVLLMSGLDSLGQLHYLGAGKTITSLLKHRNFAVRKSAISAIGRTGDLRLVYEMLKIIGLSLKSSGSSKPQSGGSSEPESGEPQSGGSEETEEGYSWEGTEVTYDTGTPGTGDQEAAERIGKAEQAAKEAAAHAAHGGTGGSVGDGGSVADGGGSGGGSGGGGSVGGGGEQGRGCASRSAEDMLRPIKEAMKQLTGEEFGGAGDIKSWMIANSKRVARRMHSLDKWQRKQAKGE